MTTRTAEEHVAMMSDPSRWPHATVLPLKRPRNRDEQGWPEMGFLYQPSMRLNTPPPEPVVYLGNIMMAADSIMNQRAVSYATLEAIVADGWEVD